MSKEIRVNYKEAYKEYERIKELFDKEDIVYSLTGSMRRKKSTIGDIDIIIKEKSIKLGKGVNLNLSKSGIGMSVGTKGMRVGTGPRGSRISANISGTGIGYSKQFDKSRKAYENEEYEDEFYEGNPVVAKFKTFIFKVLVFSLGLLTSFLSFAFLLMIFDDYSFGGLFGFLLLLDINV